MFCGSYHLHGVTVLMSDIFNTKLKQMGTPQSVYEKTLFVLKDS